MSCRTHPLLPSCALFVHIFCHHLFVWYIFTLHSYRVYYVTVCNLYYSTYFFISIIHEMSILLAFISSTSSMSLQLVIYFILLFSFYRHLAFFLFVLCPDDASNNQLSSFALVSCPDLFQNSPNGLQKCFSKICVVQNIRTPNFNL